MKEEELGRNAALARSFEHEKDMEAAAGAVAASGSVAAAAASKPYRYIEDFSVRTSKVGGPWGARERVRSTRVHASARPNPCSVILSLTVASLSSRLLFFIRQGQYQSLDVLQKRTKLSSLTLHG